MNVKKNVYVMLLMNLGFGVAREDKEKDDKIGRISFRLAVDASSNS